MPKNKISPEVERIGNELTKWLENHPEEFRKWINHFGTPDENADSIQSFDEEDFDKVNHPTHYQSYYKDGIECIDAMKSAFGEIAVAHFCACNAFKYLWRHSSKGQMEDINKALWYLNKYKEINRIDMGG